MTTDTSNSDHVLRMPLKALALRSGMALQTRRLVEGTSKKEAQFFGAIEGKGVMVGPHSSEATQTGMEAGEVCVVRGFTGQYEFSFVSKVLQTFEKPFAYALLAYPAQVDAKKVRQSLRTKVSWPTTARPLASEANAAPNAVAAQLVDLVDLSTDGAMVRTDQALGVVGQHLLLTMDLDLENQSVQLQLRGRICHHNRAPNETDYFVGLAFESTSQNDRLLLNYAMQNTGN
jgi:c-di-GMP-binding flagellar brake protein YcgR